MRISRLVPAALVVAALGVTSLPPVSSASAAPSPARAGYDAAVAWEGGVAMVCRLPASTGRSQVRVFWNGRNYRDGEYKHQGAAGLARVSSTFKLSDYTYSFGKPGGRGPLVSLTMNDAAYVNLLVGSQVGITREVVVPVSSLGRCAGARTAAPARVVAGDEAARAGRACVTRKELARVTKGLTPAKVQRVVGAKGRQVTKQSESLTRRYAKCSGGRAVVVNFQRARAGKPAKVVSRFW